MMMKKKYVSTRPIGGSRDAAGIGFLVIPKDQTSEQYIQKCYRTGTVSMAFENGGVLNNALISRSAIMDLDFPDAVNIYGSTLVWVNQPRKNQPIIIGTISRTNEFVSFNKNKSALRKATKNFVSEVVVDAEKGAIIINTNSSSEQGGDIYIIATNRSNDDTKKSKLNVRIQGDINITSTNFSLENSKKLDLKIIDKDVDDKVAEISYEKGVGFNYKDEFDNEIIANGDSIQFKPATKLNVGDGSEPAMLSDTFKSIFDDFTDIMTDLATACSEITVVASSFGSPTTVPANTASFVEASTKLKALKEKYKTFQSKISFTD